MRKFSVMNKRERIETAFLCVVFICYIALLIKMLFLSRVSLSELFSGERVWSRSINIIPFRSIAEYMFTGTDTVKSFALGNVAGNIAVFVPLGVYLPVFKKDKKILTNLLIVFIASLCIETVQWLFGIGAADIDDVLLNSLGGLVGILLYKLSVFVLRDWKRAHTVITIVSTVVGLPIIYYYLFMIKMRF